MVLSKAAFGPAPTAITKSVAELPPVRAILPTSAEAATPKEEPVAATPPVQSAPTPLTPLPEGKQTAEEEKEKGKQADRAERRKAEAEERERRKRVAERKARRDARIARQREEQQPRQPGIMAFDDAASKPSGFFGN